MIPADDLGLTNNIIQSPDTDAERYLNVTLSFMKEEVDREVSGEIVRELEVFGFVAYRRDEYHFYAEAHLPRINSGVDCKTGGTAERGAHVHVAIAGVNLVAG